MSAPFTCSQCGEGFGGLRGFDLHQRRVDRGNRYRCMDPGRVKHEGVRALVMGRRGYWVLSDAISSPRSKPASNTALVGQS